MDNNIVFNFEIVNRKLDRAGIEEQARRAYRLMAGDDGAVVELRCLDTSRGTVSGYYDSAATLADAAGQWSGDAKGVYITAQAINPLCLHRSRNTFHTYAKKESLTTDGDVTSYRKLLIDFDPVRPAGISSTYAELEVAWRRSISCGEYLAARGWHEPARASSGNGAHVVYTIDVPATDKLLIRRVLQSLAARFDDDLVNVDLTVFNPSRIWKLYGTHTRKGTPTEDRPHRHALLLDAGEPGIVPRSSLERLANDIPVATGAVTVTMPATTPEDTGDAWWKSYSGDLRTLDVVELFRDHGLEVEDDGTCDCPWKSEHSEDTTGTKVFVSEGDAFPGFNCLHSHCAGRGFRDVLEFFGHDAVNRRCTKAYVVPDVTEERLERAVERVGITGSFTPPAYDPSRYEAGDEPVTAPKKEPATRKRRGFRPSQIRQWRDPEWLIRDHLHERVTASIYGEPGIYKSFMAMDMAFSVANGIPFLGEYEAKQGPVVYIYAEGQGGFRKRLMAWESYRGDVNEDNMLLVPYAFDLVESEEELKELAEIVAEDLGQMPVLTVIDTLNRNFGAGDENTQRDMKKFNDSCDQWRDLTGGTVVIVHHTGKDRMRGERGSSVLRGALDVLIAVEREQEDDRIVTVRVDKQKDSEKITPYKVEARKEGPSLVMVPLSAERLARQKVIDQERKDYEHLRHFPRLEDEALSVDTAAKKFGLKDVPTARKRLKDLTTRKLLVCVGTGNKGDAHRYHLSKDGHDVVFKWAYQ